MNLIVNSRYNEQRLTIFTSNYEDIPTTRRHNSLLFRIGYRMRSRLHEMCEFVEMDGADYRELPVNGGCRRPGTRSGRAPRRKPRPRAGARRAQSRSQLRATARATSNGRGTGGIVGLR